MRAPTNTYRLQVRRDFDLHQAARRLPYLRDLGVDWVYLSPLLESEPGSDHGYDVVSHARVDPARGGAEGLAAFSAEARRLGLGILVDVVPNHVGIATARVNTMWWDLLRNGRGSTYAEVFDVDWEVASGKIRLPVLGDDGPDQVQVDPGDDEGAGEVRYHDHVFPLAPGSTALEEQHYELVHWTVADHGLNYRRFFGVTTLAGVRVEVPWVFEATHGEIDRWFVEGLVDGLRVDHPDGLRDPRGYLDDLARLTGDAYVLVEKVLEPGERLPATWATSGTTGYDVLGLIDRVLTDPDGAAALPTDAPPWPDLVHDRKREVADGMLGSEVRRIVRELPPSVVAGDTLPGDVVDDADALGDAVAELMACFPVYRSYLPEGREHLDQAFAAARVRRPDLAPALDVLAPVLGDEHQPAALRFQQTSGAVMAKGVEDCSFYRSNRLTSLNEVGGDPSELAVGVAELHAALAERQQDRPHAMTATSTHDTKRGEDVRARITALAEVPAGWAAASARLQELAPVPDPELARLLWQAVLGAWGSSPDSELRVRLHAYAEKAMREAGSHTTWTDPDPAFEDAVHAAVDAAFDSAEVREVVEGLLAEVEAAGRSNSLAAKLLALTMPGVPDVYQGSELAEQSLVDPDNRRPVDFDLRERLLAGREDEDGAGPHERTKLLVTATALRLRRDGPELFTAYAPVGASGAAADHALAFTRGGAVTVATRLPLGLAARGGWGDTRLELPPGTWRDALTGRPTDGVLASLLASYPVALLVREDR